MAGVGYGIMKQQSKVYNALTRGAATSTEVAQLARLSVKRCSSHLSALLQLGVVRKTGLTVQYHTRGHRSYCYEVVA